ncbi:hypothetical protein ACLI09_03260 [Flavobacterium sp. RHBU_24]|uniref:hypothetical protein n=1 Tax=Flavobacterium sp. RHBU_24 TaxID=3391185 RepID=UPI0039848093
MRMILILFIIFPLLLQGQNCLCPPESCFFEVWTEPQSIFTFSDGTKVKICAPVQVIIDDDKETYYTYLTTSICNGKIEIPFVDRYDIFIFSTSFENDTLTVSKYLPIPKGHSNTRYKSMKCEINKIFIKDGILTTISQLMPIQSPYTPKEEKYIIKQFEAGSEELKGDIERLYTRLFVLALVGNEKAKNYFLHFEQLYKELDDDSIHDYKYLADLFKEKESTTP